MKKVISTLGAPQAIGAYSQAIRANGFLFVSGQIPLDPVTGDLAYGGVSVQAHQILANIKSILSAESLSFADVVKSTIFLANMDDFKTVNDIYAQYFKEAPPARSCVQAARLPRGAELEIEIIAAYPS
ncbi:MAG: RidA family protein [Acidaminococcales bacterium]|nr:RidA family protein [Acidaminococcales bacterium]